MYTEDRCEKRAKRDGNVYITSGVNRVQIEDGGLVRGIKGPSEGADPGERESDCWRCHFSGGNKEVLIMARVRESDDV